MKKIDSKIFVVMFVLTMGFLFLSGLQRELRIVKLRRLNGAIEIPEIKKLNFKNYYNFSFQKSVEKNIEANFGFKEPLIRMYNQYVWDFYRKKHSRQVLVGKDNWLFPNWHKLAPKYSKELTDKFDQQAQYLFQLSNVLKEYNTQIIVCFIPSKLEIYKEYDTSDLKREDNFNPINYFCEKFESSGVNYINLTQMMYDFKDTAVFMPFTPTGAHWSNIATVYAADSIFKRFESLSGINMPKLKIGKPYIGKTREPDNDLEQMYNLCRPLHHQTDYYVDIELLKDSTTVKPTMITIADSHFWTFYYNLKMKEIFTRFPYWYYANTIYFDKPNQNVSQVDKMKEFVNADFILFLYSANQAYNIDTDILIWPLIELCINKEEVETKIAHIVETINSDTEWKSKTEKKALEGNKTFEETAYSEARYVIRQNPYKFFPQLNATGVPYTRSRELELILNPEIATTEERVLEILNSMRSSEEWMTALKEKAEIQGKTLDEVMHGDALWLIKKEDDNKKENK